MKWILPEYVEDILPAEARRRRGCGEKSAVCFSKK
jgi:hypothetical protein